ncbi:pyridoxamine 5'-phosphate oxidase family protein [Shinella sp. CPCC 101442]|uniref:pyridoxamine 5'-phosphate oxidase family protein n=1 Tax=Shinella sp. CPCC 101442 TaxID=2932265 RepID=UPI0021520361|nr:pyridoxamine 5'-phosphate oxidase family protein [Shinella sp. CPCC 101442]MCR6497471.1 pyridoxamine 5'-phosphate oxidase family protein [Shinella sp. CPCC 101442]
MTATILATIWERLDAAATSRSPFNFLQLATTGADGAPQLRTIVLRGCNVERGTLSFVTDMRSPKIREIQDEPRVALVGFDPTASVQLRLSGKAAIVSDEAERRAMWEALRERTLILFDAPHAPGTVLGDGNQPLEAVEPSATGSAYDRFALVTVTLTRLEWLDLSPPDHIRYAFERQGADWRGTRLAP